jgi:hypothetical protein
MSIPSVNRDSILEAMKVFDATPGSGRKPTESIMLKKLFVVAALGLVPNTLQAKDLPACDSDQVQETLFKAVRPYKFYEIKDQRCFFSGPLQGAPGGPYQEAIFTLEWINESEGRWWLDIKQRQQTCPGTSSSPNDNSRCG